MASPSSSFSPFTAARVVKADPAFLTRPHADASILALAALLNPAGIDAEQVRVNQKLVRNMFVHEEVLNILKRPWEHNKDQPIISACCLLLKRVRTASSFPHLLRVPLAHLLSLGSDVTQCVVWCVTAVRQ
jgi:hypothetical protein